MKLLSAQDIWQTYSMSEAIEDVADAFRAVARSDTKDLQMPLRTRITIDDMRTFLMMPCYSRDRESLAIKTIGLFPGNAKRNLATAPASIVLMDAQTGMMRALLDGDVVTKIRTGASSGVAFRALATQDAEIGLVVGTGGQAATQAIALLTACPHIKELRIANPIPGEAQRFIRSLPSHPLFAATGFSGSLLPFEDAAEASKDADVIILVTSSTTPVLGADYLKPGVTISCVGSYQPHMQECGADIMERADAIYCDNVSAALAESGDLIIPRDQGIIREDSCKEIADVLDGTISGRRSEKDIIVYETVGVAAQDLWAAHSIVRAAEEANIGANWQE